MTTENELHVIPACALELGDLLAGGSKGLLALADQFAIGLTDAGLPASSELQGDWVKMTIVTNEGPVSFAIMEPEVPGLAKSALPLRLGVRLAFGIPSGEELLDKPDTFFYVPASFTIDQLLALCCGAFSPDQFTHLLNFSVRHSMSAPRKRFPSSILLMIADRTQLHTVGNKRFELWTQSRGVIDIIELKASSNPHVAAAEAKELGFHPTVYRCQSGAFITFKSTDGGPFL
ncbi:hypothetical protein H8F21_15130 [Pseudomonas sp. P66]|uniref:Uncharacterized protein n=1 Tax=Pseudomonas arcuscaelestis TaxID=2710591 RepID=A0ABS2BZ48_9PSED|nr:hypothetical protein [Pseudomonas arcuscaelestis]MBM5458898.1 hypothetical protein [Pseudomonas arcuscaelestis]